jgi:hypothetical protein
VYRRRASGRTGLGAGIDEDSLGRPADLAQNALGLNAIDGLDHFSLQSFAFAFQENEYARNARKALASGQRGQCAAEQLDLNVPIACVAQFGGRSMDDLAPAAHFLMGEAPIEHP